ncbi:YbbR-like domain-containing protein [Brevibacillus sp. B_LB10_24]|uniref:CdaR family protein n=1 Tax=Brevibacillus sp. B_LB10_24 TaxID=3380645 RepID=UPI0038BD58E6
MDRWLNSPWFVRAIALLMAIMLWMAVNIEPQPGPGTDTNRPMIMNGLNLKVYYDSDRYEVVRAPQSVSVAVESSNPFFRYSIGADQLEVYVDLRGKGKGVHRVPVQYKGFPSDARVAITPSTVEVTLEEKQTVEKEVKVELLGQVAAGYTAGTPEVKPERVHVIVPESQVNNVAYVKATVNLEGATSPINTSVELKVVDKQGNVMPQAEVTPHKVEVNVPVTSPFIIVPIKINLTNDLPDGYSLASVQTSTEEVTVFGPQDVIRGLTVYPGPDIDLSNITSDRLLQLKIPLVDKVVKVQPDDLEVTLKVVRSQTKQLKGVPLRISGLSDDLQAKILTPEGQEITTIDFDVIGAPQNLKDLTPDNAQIIADVSNLPIGVHEIPIIYKLPNYLKTAPNAIKQVTVEITSKQG